MIASQTEVSRPGGHSNAGQQSAIRWKPYGGEWEVTTFEPYFYVDSSEGFDHPKAKRIEREHSVAYDGTAVDRVVLWNTRDMRDVRREADNHYEADIPFERRFFIDEIDEGFGDEYPEVLHLDIEVATDGALSDPQDAEDPVVSASTYYEGADRHADFLFDPRVNERTSERVDWGGAGGAVHRYPTEWEMLQDLCEMIRETGIEVITGWNVDSFDCVYLIARLNRLRSGSEHDLSPTGEAYIRSWSGDDHAVIDGIDVFDLLLAYKRSKRRDQPPNYRLATVATHEGLDVEKMDADGTQMERAWRDDPMRVMEYNRRDSYLTSLLDDEMGLIDFFLTMHRELAVPLPDTLHNSVIVEMFVMSHVRGWGVERTVLDSKTSSSNRFEGGRTLQPDEGVYENVLSVDVTSEYPNWVRAANISPETAVPPDDPEYDRDDLIRSPTGVKFLPHDEQLGLLPRAVDGMFRMKSEKTEERARHDYGTPEYERANRERRVSKELLNSIQGVTGMESHRLSSNACSSSITAFGRETVARMVEIGEDQGLRNVYGDTDSAFFVDPHAGDPEDAVGAARQVAAAMNQELPEWAASEFGVPEDRAENIQVEPEKVAKRAFFPDVKKRYTLWLAWNDGEWVDKITHTGWGHIKSDTSVAEARIQKKALEAIMHGWQEERVTERVNEEIRDIRSGDAPLADIARPKGTTRGLANYGDDRSCVDFSGVPYQVAAMISSNELLGHDWKGGERPLVLPVNAGKTVRKNGTTNHVNYLAITGDEELPDWAEVDYDKVARDIKRKLETIYRSMGWSHESIDNRSERLTKWM